MASDDYAGVPAADADAVVDPHWLELRGPAILPPTYMPPSMGGRRSPLIRVTAVALVVVFVTATAAGVCLTYGPDLFGG